VSRCQVKKKSAATAPTMKEDDDAEREPVDARCYAGDAAHTNLLTRGDCVGGRGGAGGLR
jgi:hypothetical protein